MWKKKSIALAALLLALGGGLGAAGGRAHEGEGREGAQCTCGNDQGAHEEEGAHAGKARGHHRGRRGGHGGGHGGDHADMGGMASAHALLARHDQVQRRVEELPGGVETWTTSDDAEVAELLRAHVRQMKRRLESGRPVRRMDPLFREIFKQRDKIRMEIEDVPGGVRVVETSDDPQVALLIQEHARLVNGFVEEGMKRAHQRTPLPEGYAPAE